MKWSWKTFALQLVSALVLGLGLAFLISMVIDARQGPGAPDSTLLSTAIGGMVAPLVLAALGGWKGWGLKPLLVAGAIVSTLYAGNPCGGLLVVLVAALVYYSAHKAHGVMCYYFPRESSRTDSQHTES